MRVILEQHGLPLWWRKEFKIKGLVDEFNIVLTKRAKIQCKVLLFESQDHMRQFNKKFKYERCGKEEDIGDTCPGLCDQLYSYSVNEDESLNTIWVDPVFFSVIMLCHERLGMAIITHESIHAAFAYSRRTTTKWPDEDYNPEERICYPAANIASQINSYFHDHGRYAHYQKDRKRISGCSELDIESLSEDSGDAANQEPEVWKQRFKAMSSFFKGFIYRTNPCKDGRQDNPNR